MAFRVRRVTSGLSPQQHEVRPAEPSHIARFSKAPVLEFDSDDERDPPLETPTSVRGARAETLPSENDSASFAKTIPIRKAQAESITDSEAIRNNKLITDDNQFSPPQKPQTRLFSPRRLNPPQDVEFDSSDHESPFRVPLSTERGTKRRLSDETENNYEKPGLDKTNFEKTFDRTFDKIQIPNFDKTHTPRRQSPLRKEIVPSSATTASDIVNEIQHSSAVRSQSTQEILDKINMSMDRMREFNSNDGDAGSDSDLSDRDADLMRDLDQFLPKKTKPDDARFASAREKGSPIRSPKVAPIRSPKLAPIPISEKDSKLETSSKIDKSPKLAALPIPRERSSSTSTKRRRTKIEPWSYEKWSKLQRLVESSIPNHIISNNEIVMRELGCRNKQELAQRVKFLQRKR